MAHGRLNRIALLLPGGELRNRYERASLARENRRTARRIVLEGRAMGRAPGVSLDGPPGASVWMLFAVEAATAAVALAALLAGALGGRDARLPVRRGLPGSATTGQTGS